MSRRSSARDGAKRIMMLIIIFGVIVAAFLVSCNTSGPASFAPAPFSVANTPQSAAGMDIYAGATLEAAQAIRAQADIAIAEATAEQQRLVNEREAITRAFQVQEHERAVALTAAADAILIKQESDAATAQVLELTAESERQVKATGTAEAIAADAYNLELTRAAMELERRQDRYLRDQRRANFFNIFVPTVLSLGTLLLMFFGFLYVMSRLSKPDYVTTPSHAWMILQVPEPGIRGLVSRTPQAQPLLPPPGDIIDGELSVNGDSVPDTRAHVPLMVNGEERDPVTLSREHGDRNPERSNRAIVRRLLRESRTFLDEPPPGWRYGDRRDVLPGNRHLSLNADEWSRAVQVLKKNKVVETTQGGTFFTGSWDIDTALMPTNRNRLDYSPTPPA